jgi:two-component system response regulator PilR (NtrC family)
VETAVRALKLGAFDFVSANRWTSARCASLVTSAMKLGERADGDGLTIRGRGCSAIRCRCRQLREMIARVARSQAPIHIAGESRHRQGTGRAADPRLTGPRAEGPVRAR